MEKDINDEPILFDSSSKGYEMSHFNISKN